MSQALLSKIQKLKQAKQDMLHHEMYQYFEQP